MPGNESRVRVASRTAASDRLVRSSATSLRSALRSSLNQGVGTSLVTLRAQALVECVEALELQPGQLAGS